MKHPGFSHPTNPKSKPPSRRHHTTTGGSPEMGSSSNYKNIVKTSMAIADTASFLCAIGLIALILMCAVTDRRVTSEPVKGRRFTDRPCDEIYVVGEGETLHTISDKCGDPYIVERNPHIHDPDDVFPGLVIKIVPPSTSFHKSTNMH